ncbi:MAG: hypothetical protein WC712_13520, partial [Candidatus Brocadiia bacterium]
MANKLIGVIVDGPGDFASVRGRFLGQCRILKTDGPRGHTAKVAEIANQAFKQIKMLTDLQCSSIVVVLDFEERTESYGAFVASIRRAFQSLDCDADVNIAVPNRMIENWYLADIEEISRKKAFIRKGLKQKSYEGKNGKDEVKKCMARKMAYSETMHGPQMFSVVRFDVARTNSQSLAEFL